ncbi:MAG: hypothetical protein EPO16_11710 [Dehalococcoidia bacterium]|nr:MAG: hypothetical protein EPO16_11710 [Dehalococcoidia bacterium]
MIALIEAEPSLFAAVLAGWVSGFAVALAGTGYLMFGLSRAKVRPPTGLNVSLPIFGIVAVNAFVIAWTLAGIFAGVAYHLAGQPRFTAGVAAIHLLAALVYTVARGWQLGWEGRAIWATWLTSLAAFSGLLPFLAARA